MMSKRNSSGVSNNNNSGPIEILDDSEEEPIEIGDEDDDDNDNIELNGISINSCDNGEEDDECEEEEYFDEESEKYSCESDDDLIYVPTKEARVVPYQDTFVQFYTNDMFQLHFKISKSSFSALMDIISEDYVVVTRDRPDVTLEKSLLLTIWCLANGESFEDVASRFSITPSVAYTSFVNICQIVSKYRDEYICWITEAEAKENAEKFESLAEHAIPNVVGCVGIIKIPIIRDERLILLQAICDVDGRFINVHTAVSQSSSCKEFWKESPIYSKLKGGLLKNECHILGGPTYPSDVFLLTPYTNIDGDNQKKMFNDSLLLMRTPITTAFIKLKTIFQRLKEVDVKKIDKIIDLINISCILHNIRASEVFDTVIDNLNEEEVLFGESESEEVADPCKEDSQEVSEKRDSIASLMLAPTTKSHININNSELANYSNDVVNIIKCLINEDYEETISKIPSVDVDEAIKLMLYIFANDNSFGSISESVHTSISDIHKIFYNVCKLLTKFEQKYIAWPSIETIMSRTKSGEFDNTVFPNVVGCIDAMKLQIHRNGLSLLVQVICDCEFRIIDVHVGRPGVLDKIIVLKESPIYKKLNEKFLDDNLHILGDSTYPLDIFLMTPYQSEGEYVLTSTQLHFNKVLQSTHKCIKATFARMKNILKRLSNLNMLNTDNIKYILTAACMVYNMSLKETSGSDLDDTQEEFGTHCETPIPKQKAIKKRDSICLSLSNGNKS